jgi:hypothetical protein
MTRLLQSARALAIGAALAFSVAAPANAAETFHTDYIRFIYPLSNGNFVIGMVVSPPTCTGASSPSKYLHVIVGEQGVTSDGAKAMLASALTALSMGQRVSVVFEDSTSTCSVNRLIINSPF